jgi:ATP adenylyltransferase
MIKADSMLRDKQMVDEQRIWAPWRIGYIATGEKTDETQILPNTWQPGADHGCFLCRAAGEYADQTTANRQNLVVTRDRVVLTLLNRYPYTNGHLLVAPLRHVGELSDLTDAEQVAAMKALSRFTQLLRDRISAEGFNVGLNLGKIAGAGVPGHLHWHLVPRWSGDNNFMPTVAGTRVIPQSLDALWEALTEDRV